MSKFGFGVAGHINYPTLGKSSDAFTPSARFGFGLFGNYLLNPRLRAQLEVNYNSMSFQLNGQSVKLFKDYLETPLILYYKTLPQNNWMFQAGLSPALTVNTQVQNPAQGSGTITTDGEDGRLDLSVMAGFQFPVSKKTDFSIRYYYTPTKEETSTNITGRAAALQASLIIHMDRFMRNIKEEEEDTALTRELNTLINGALLVRLNYPDSRIARYKREGKQKKVDQLILEYDIKNKAIVKAFKDSFDYCPVYFFKSGNSLKVASGDFDGVFVDDSLQIVSSIKLDRQNYCIAEFGDVIRSSGSTIRGLVVYNKSFEQMREPFPYFINNTIGRPYPLVVAAFNRKLKSFYANRLFPFGDR